MLATDIETTNVKNIILLADNVLSLVNITIVVVSPTTSNTP